MNSKAKQTIERITSFKYELILEGICVGAITGAVVSLFRLALIHAESLRGSVISNAVRDPEAAMIAILLLLILFFGTCLCLKFVPLCSGSGIPQVKGELRGRVDQGWWQMIIAKLAGGVMSIGAGLSLGREGPSIQLGAMVGKGFSRIGNKLRTEEKLLMTCGAGAGLSCAFCAPLAGVVFTLEGLHRNFSNEILLSTMAAAIASDFVAYNVFGLSPVFDLHIDKAMPLKMYWLIIVLGIVMGAFGVFYNKVTDLMQDAYDKISSKYVRISLPFIAVIPLAFMYPLALGSGYKLVGQVARGEFILSALAILLIVKFIYSIFSFSSGAPGGIFLPLLVIGAITGGLFSAVCGQISGNESFYMANFVIFGMTGFFAAIVRSPITGVILITEMTGDFSHFLPLCIAALASYITADLLNGQPIYDQLLNRMLAKDQPYGMTQTAKKHKIMIQCDVYIGAPMDGERIEKMLLPKGCLVVSVVRGSDEFVPNGKTILAGGDKLTVLCEEGDLDPVQTKLNNICKTIRQ